MPSSKKRRRARKHRGEMKARFRVRCSGKLHWILLTDQGRLVLTAHPDLGAEDVVTAMTGETCRCVQIQKQWCAFIKHGTKTMRLADLPRDLQPWADDAHKRTQMRTEIRNFLKNHDRANFFASLEEKLDEYSDSDKRLKALKRRITRELTKKADDYAGAILQNCRYHRPPHVCPKFISPTSVVINSNTTFPNASTFSSYDDGLMSHEEGFGEYGVRRRYSLHCHQPLNICWSFVVTGGTAHDPANNTRVAVIELQRPKPRELRDDQEIAYAGRQNDVTTVVRTQRCLLHRGKAGWEVAEWLPEKAD